MRIARTTITALAATAALLAGATTHAQAAYVTTSFTTRPGSHYAIAFLCSAKPGAAEYTAARGGPSTLTRCNPGLHMTVYLGKLVRIRCRHPEDGRRWVYVNEGNTTERIRFLGSNGAKLGHWRCSADQLTALR